MSPEHLPRVIHQPRSSATTTAKDQPQHTDHPLPRASAPGVDTCHQRVIRRPPRDHPPAAPRGSGPAAARRDGLDRLPHGGVLQQREVAPRHVRLLRRSRRLVWARQQRRDSGPSRRGLRQRRGIFLGRRAKKAVAPASLCVILGHGLLRNLEATRLTSRFGPLVGQNKTPSLYPMVMTCGYTRFRTHKIPHEEEKAVRMKLDLSWMFPPRRKCPNLLKTSINIALIDDFLLIRQNRLRMHVTVGAPSEFTAAGEDHALMVVSALSLFATSGSDR